MKSEHTSIVLMHQNPTFHPRVSILGLSTGAESRIFISAVRLFGSRPGFEPSIEADRYLTSIPGNPQQCGIHLPVWRRLLWLSRPCRSGRRDSFSPATNKSRPVPGNSKFQISNHKQCPMTETQAATLSVRKDGRGTRNRNAARLRLKYFLTF